VLGAVGVLVLVFVLDVLVLVAGVRVGVGLAVVLVLMAVGGIVLVLFVSHRDLLRSLIVPAAQEALLKATVLQ
jgi:hypothetical protein